MSLRLKIANSPLYPPPSNRKSTPTSPVSPTVKTPELKSVLWSDTIGGVLVGFGKLSVTFSIVEWVLSVLVGLDELSVTFSIVE